MVDTERSVENIERLHREVLRERAEGLREAARTTSARLIAREEAIARLRAQIASLKASLDGPRPDPAKEAAMDSARAAATSFAGFGRLAPYAAILACAAFLEFGGARRPESAALSALARPAPAAIASGHAAARGAPVVIDEDRSPEALLLVREWTLPGDEKTLGERLGGELDLPGGRPAWSAERTGAHGYRVTYQAGVNALPYVFEADLEARIVWPAPETQELLTPRIAALRDAVR